MDNRCRADNTYDLLALNGRGTQSTHYEGVDASKLRSLASSDEISKLLEKYLESHPTTDIGDVIFSSNHSSNA